MPKVILLLAIGAATDELLEQDYRGWTSAISQLLTGNNKQKRGPIAAVVYKDEELLSLATSIPRIGYCLPTTKGLAKRAFVYTRQKPRARYQLIPADVFIDRLQEYWNLCRRVLLDIRQKGGLNVRQVKKVKLGKLLFPSPCWSPPCRGIA